MRKLFLFNVLIFSFLLSFGQTPGEQSAIELHRHLLTLDSHTDTPLWLLREGIDFMSDNKTKAGSKVDYLRMQEGGLDAVFMAVFTPQGKTDSSGYARAYAQAMELFNAIHQLVSRYPDQLALATQPDQVIANADKGKVSILIGVENGYPLGEDIRRVEEFYRLGARYITLSHTRNNQICDASTDKFSAGGLTEFGREVVREMNRLGMLVDVSHISDAAFYDVIKTSTKPVIASHSNARAVCESSAQPYRRHAKGVGPKWRCDSGLPVERLCEDISPRPGKGFSLKGMGEALPRLWFAG
jgi:membrane dipeptidase